MFERFLGTFAVSDGPMPMGQATTGTLGAWLDMAGGRTFADGLYRVHTRASARASNALVLPAHGLR